MSGNMRMMGCMAGEGDGPLFSGETVRERPSMTDVFLWILILCDIVCLGIRVGGGFVSELIGEPGARDGAENT